MRRIAIAALFLSSAPVFAAPAASPSPKPTPTSAARENLTVQLKQMVFNAQDKLGPLEEWQRKLFEEEVLAEPQRFVRDYRQSNDGFTGEVDIASIRRFLKLYGPKLGSEPAPKILVYLRADPSCTKCVGASPQIQEMVVARLARRGLTPIAATVEEVGDANLSGKPLDDRLSDIAAQKSCVASLAILWQLAPLDDVDSAHADDKRYLVKTSMTVKGVGHNDDQLEILDTDSFEKTAERLYTNAVTDLGAKVEEAQLRQEQDKQEEISIAMTGFKDFAQYTHARGVLGERLKDVAIEERKVSRGRVIFGVKTALTREQLKKHLGATALEPGVRVEVQ